MTDRVEVKVIAGRDIHGAMDEQCDPFVEVRCGPELHVTKTQRQSRDPEWNSVVMAFTNVVKGHSDHVLVIVKHRLLSAPDDQALGMVPVDLATS